MAQDIKLIQDSNGDWDIDFENGDFKLTSGLDTALYMSVLCEKRASPSQVKEPTLRRGHFTNIFNSVQDYEVGSLLWLYTYQARNTQSNASLAEQAINQGLSWLLEDNILTKINTSISRSGNSMTVNIDVKTKFDSNSNYYDLFINTTS